MPLRDAKEVMAQSHLTVAIWGPPKTGKTLTALKIAAGMAEGRKFAVLDTERKGAVLYARSFNFDVEAELPNYSPDSYRSFLRAADGRYPVLVIDSLSHGWIGTGGVLEIAGRAGTGRDGSPFGGWGVAGPAQQKFIDELLSTKSHLVCTMRAKTAWEIVRNDRGKLEPHEVGEEAVQREGVRYEFDALLRTDDPERNVVTSAGSRLYCSDGRNLLAGYEKEKPGEELGQMMLGWLRTEGADRMGVLAGMLRAKLGADAELLIRAAATADELQAMLDSLR